MVLLKSTPKSASVVAMVEVFFRRGFLLRPTGFLILFLLGVPLPSNFIGVFCKPLFLAKCPGGVVLKGGWTPWKCPGVTPADVNCGGSVSVMSMGKYLVVAGGCGGGGCDWVVLGMFTSGMLLPRTSSG